MTDFYFIIFQINMNFDVLVISVIVLVCFKTVFYNRSIK